MSLPRLSRARLAQVSAGVARPVYDSGAVRTGIVHLGLGAFHRAHQAVYTEAALAAGDLRWGILGASLRNPDTRDALAPQDGLYTVAVRSAEGVRCQVVGAVRELCVAPERPTDLLAALVRPTVRIVSLTVTEKGYYVDPGTHALLDDHPDIRHDLAHPAEPCTAIGFLASALARRRAAGVAPFTILSCDNLPANGKVLHRALARFATLRDPDLGRFIAADVACPSTMVDRIVPATTAQDRAEVSASLGLEDAWPVVTEPFSQWVIEDRFTLGRPDWSLAGAQFVRDVAPFELMKLRLLNGAHSTIAYLGQLAGYETVADAMADPDLATFVELMLREEIAPTLSPATGIDPSAYIGALLARFRNPALKHRLVQIAADGSQKLPQRLLGSVRDRLAAHAGIDRLALAVAAWMRFATGIDERGGTLEVNDPLRDELRRRFVLARMDARRLAPAFVKLAAVFGRDLSRDPVFLSAVTAALDDLIRLGTRETVRRRARPN